MHQIKSVIYVLASMIPRQLRLYCVAYSRHYWLTCTHVRINWMYILHVYYHIMVTACIPSIYLRMRQWGQKQWWGPIASYLTEHVFKSNAGINDRQFYAVEEHQHIIWMFVLQLKTKYAVKLKVGKVQSLRTPDRPTM